ncbi:glycoside hydrolase family 30 protein [Stenotrophomonas sp. NLF4-10]|uniref:glycoside hydrolase family 30 protein n=1 Tax=Stenotrophomonas sp. NLF4-10 TaxID=2918754 RepID=UPI001EFAEB03|nr:glycoside hydrolase family 30 protein [Stenotrophomonas sp. NLF4-10]MCG8274948.1 glycosyl hydrolase [Stenotrophomonas sp. NLF4-10]
MALPAQAGDRLDRTGEAVVVYTTAQGATRQMVRSQVAALSEGHALTEVENSVFVEPGRRFQTFLGIGGAITDATAETFAKLDDARQAELLRAYYDPEQGIGYTLARTTIHSSDFSSGSYTYIAEGDASLASFSVEHDRRYRIPMIKRAIAAAGGTLPLMASPWSAPAFMKDSKDMLHGGKLLPQYADAWAKYYVKFLDAYQAEGIPVWAISLQNEPMAKQTWESMLFTAEEERDFLKNHLGPTIRNSKHADTKIVVWDHNRDMMVHRANVIFGDPEAAQYAWGMGFHWYETWAGFEPMFDNVARVHDAWPDKVLLLTEATVEKFDWSQVQRWANGERYGTSIIHDLNNGASAWIDWNMLLDETGGPNHVGNYCFSPVHADTRSGELVYTPSYWYIGHFSKFLRPGAQRVSAASSRSNLLATAFVNADGTLATVVMNPTGQPITYNYYVGTASTRITIPAHGIQTLLR